MLLSGWLMFCARRSRQSCALKHRAGPWTPIPAPAPFHLRLHPEPHTRGLRRSRPYGSLPHTCTSGLQGGRWVSCRPDSSCPGPHHRHCPSSSPDPPNQKLNNYAPASPAWPLPLTLCRFEALSRSLRPGFSVVSAHTETALSCPQLLSSPASSPKT